MAHDIPMHALLRRLDMLHAHYGPGTSVQITGGDPTLRKTEDLERLCREIRDRGMRSCLMTNGIRATRPMLARLANAGLDDVAFHVDLTQERPGFTDEVALNKVRSEYMSRAHELGLRILFNTTVFEGNLRQIPDLVRFFVRHGAEITLASFQLQADTGRGVLRDRPDAVSQATVMQAIAHGVGAPVDFDRVAIGHSDCNRYVPLLTAGGHAIPALPNKALVAAMIDALEAEERRIDAHLEVTETFRRVFLRRPSLALAALGHGLRLAWQLRRGLWRSKGRVGRIAFLVHNFMDATALDEDRCAACTFMVATEDGPLSMCAHNASRDKHLFAPVKMNAGDGPGWWSAATGRITETPNGDLPVPVQLKRMKGRQRVLELAARAAARSRDGGDTP